MQIGTVAKVSLSGISGEPLEGKVDLIEPVLDESTRTNRVRILVKNDQNKLRPGQFGEVEFELPASAGLFVPRDAVIHTGDLEYVYVAIDGDQFEPRRVTTGVAREGRTQVLSGLREGERVVTRGSFMLDSESRLQASLSGTPAPSTSKSSSADMGPSCEVEFDAAKAPDKYRQCLACEKQHASMGRMVSDCKNAISRPWR
jgi:Cu(I)/Ag(I) efflux system membrane fusion protein